MKKLFFVYLLWHSINIFSATHLVTNTYNSGSGSFRQAILNANADTSSPRIIAFEIDSGPQIISPLSQLPALTASNIIIDGTTQPGWEEGSPQIILDGTYAVHRFDGITIDKAENCTIQGLVINNCFLRGIVVLGNSNDAQIYECFIGTTQDGASARGNRVGIMICASALAQNNNTIIGAPDRGNIISGNIHAGIQVSGNVDSLFIQSNKIGTDLTGYNSVSNQQAGIIVGTMPINSEVVCSRSKIGEISQEGNLISGNGPTGAGIIAGFQSIIDLTIEGNSIGLDIAGTFTLANAKNIVMIESIVSNLTEITIENNAMGSSL